MPKRRLNAYQREYDTRKRWLPLRGQVIAEVRVRSVRGVSVERGIGRGGGFDERKNRSFAVQSAIDDAIVKHIERFSDKDDLRSVKESYGQQLIYDKSRYSDSRGGFDTDSMGIQSAKVLSLRVRYSEKNVLVKTERRGKSVFTVIRDRRGRFVKGGFVRHDDDSRVVVDDRSFGFAVDPHDDPLEEFR